MLQGNSHNQSQTRKKLSMRSQFCCKFNQRFDLFVNQISGLIYHQLTVDSNEINIIECY